MGIGGATIGEIIGAVIAAIIRAIFGRDKPEEFHVDKGEDIDPRIVDSDADLLDELGVHPRAKGPNRDDSDPPGPSASRD